MSYYQDRTLNCSDCKDSFVFTAGEQEFHASKGFSNAPGRCPSCRAARKAARGDAPAYGNARSSGSPSRMMHDAVCAGCSKETQVPFMPTGSRPVYCRDCFSQQRSYSRY